MQKVISLRHKEIGMFVANHTHNSFHACNSHSYISRWFQDAKNIGSLKHTQELEQLRPGYLQITKYLDKFDITIVRTNTDETQ